MNREYQKMNKIEPYNDEKLTYDENTKINKFLTSFIISFLNDI